MSYNNSSMMASTTRPSSYASSYQASTHRSSTSTYASNSSSSTSTYGSSCVGRTNRSGSVSSSHIRSTSLDRTISLDTPSYRVTSSSTRPSVLLSTSLNLVTSRPPRSGSSILSTSGSMYLIDRSKRLDLPSSLDIKARISNLRSNSMRMRTAAARSGCDALHDCVSSPVLTNYRRLGDVTTSGSSRILGGSRRASSTRRSSVIMDNLELATADQVLLSSSTSNSIYGSNSNLRDSDSGLSASSSGSSSPSLSTGHSRSHSNVLLDENSNRTFLRYKYDSNHNLCPSLSKNSDEEADSKSNGSSGGESPSSTHSSRRSRFGSNEDVYSYGRRRRNSGQASTSGYSSDASNSSNSGGGGGSPGSNIFRKDNKYENSGMVGLRNLGNTCFMNSVLQCLSNSKPLLEYCLRESYIADTNMTISSMKGGLIRAFGTLLQSMWKTVGSESSVSPHAFKSQVQKFAPRFMGYSQQDAQEFLRYLLQGLHEDVNRVTVKPSPLNSEIDDNVSDNQKASESWRRYLRLDDSKIVDLFVGQLKSTLRCTFCGHTSVTFDPFWDLSLPIPKSVGSVKLSQCFDLFTREEVLDGDEKPTCSKCKARRKCTKSFTLQKFPKILVIHLKRFSPSEKYKAKLTTTVDFPLYNLDLGGFATNGSRGQNCTYNLYGVSNHSGTVYTGHYTAYCKHPYSGDWHDFNDSRVSKVQSSSITSSEAYVLFYEQVTHSSRL